MWISQGDCHSPKFSLPHNSDLSVRALMELFVSNRIIRSIRSHKNAYGSAKADRFMDVIDSKYIYYLLNGDYLAFGQVVLL